MNDQQIVEQFERADAQWTGPRLIGLLMVTLGIALCVIYFIACVRSGDFVWHPFANDVEQQAPISDW